MDLKPEQQEILESLLPKIERRTLKGRPRQDKWSVLNGILWVLRTGAPWHDLPERYPPYQTCHRYFQGWVKSGVMDKILKALAEDLRARGKLDLSECFIDATFAGAKKGVYTLDLLNVAKGPRSWQLQTAMVFLSPCILKAPLATKQNWLKRPLISVFSAKNQEEW